LNATEKPGHIKFRKYHCNKIGTYADHRA
jgi:hypothetical protein